MTDPELIEFALDFREGILGGRSSNLMCAAVSWPMASLLRVYGVPCETRESQVGECNHIWIELADGRVLDPTADQFNGHPAIYLGPPTELHSNLV